MITPQRNGKYITQNASHLTQAQNITEEEEET